MPVLLMRLRAVDTYQELCNVYNAIVSSKTVGAGRRSRMNQAEGTAW